MSERIGDSKMIEINQKFPIKNGVYYINCASQLILMDYLNDIKNLPYNIYITHENVFITNEGSKLDLRLSSLIDRIDEDQYRCVYINNERKTTYTNYAIIKASISQIALDYIISNNLFKIEIRNTRGLLMEKVKSLILHNLTHIRERDKKLRTDSKDSVWKNLSEYMSMIEDFSNPETSTISQVKSIYEKNEASPCATSKSRVRSVASLINLNKYYKFIVLYPIELGYALDKMIGRYNEDVLIGRLSTPELKFDLNFYRRHEAIYTVMKDCFILKNNYADDRVKVYNTYSYNESYNFYDLLDIIDKIQNFDYKIAAKNKSNWPHSLKLHSIDTSIEGMKRMRNICNHRMDIEMTLFSFWQTMKINENELKINQYDIYGYNTRERAEASMGLFSYYMPFDLANVGCMIEDLTTLNDEELIASREMRNNMASFIEPYIIFPTRSGRVSVPNRSFINNWHFVNMIVLSLYYMMIKNLSLTTGDYKLKESEEIFFKKYLMIESKRSNKLTITSFYSRLFNIIVNQPHSDLDSPNLLVGGKRFSINQVKQRLNHRNLASNSFISAYNHKL